MHGVELVVILLAVSAALRLVARRLHVPHPVLLVLAGLALVFVPGLPQVEFEPDALFLVFVPPLLYWAALTSSLRDFRAQSGPSSAMGRWSCCSRSAAVAVVAHALTPEFTWAAAFTLGAIVSPPDPVAAIAVLRTIGARPAPHHHPRGRGPGQRCHRAGGLPGGHRRRRHRRLLPWTHDRPIPPGRHGRRCVGLGVGWLLGQVRRRVRGSPIVENTISLLTPFFAYLPAEWLGLSGVLSVVAVGLYFGRLGPRIVRPRPGCRRSPCG